MPNIQVTCSYNQMYVFLLQAENIYNDEEPDTPASELEQQTQQAS